MATQYIETPSESLNGIIKAAESRGRNFYIGAAGQNGLRAVDAVIHRDIGGHHVDRAMGFPAPIVHHTPLMLNDIVSSLEAGLIREYIQYGLCENQRHGYAGAIRAEMGVVYIRTYYIAQ